MEQLTAVVQETTFRNEENGYTVLRVGSGRSQQTVVGMMPELSPAKTLPLRANGRSIPSTAGNSAPKPVLSPRPLERARLKNTWARA